MSAPDDKGTLAEREGDPDEDPRVPVAVGSPETIDRRSDGAAHHYVDHATRGRAALTGRMFASLSNPHFRLFMAAMMGQMGAMNMQMVARSWFMYELTGSAALLGAVGLANGLPLLLLSLYGGVIADRVAKKNVLIVGQIASAVLALVVAVLISTSIINWQLLIVASLAQGVIMALMMPSRQAVIPELVGEQGLTNAVALNTAGMNLNRLTAPGVAGLMIAVIGIESVYYVMTGLYIVATLFAMALPITGTTSLSGGNAMDNVKEGLRYIKDSPVLPTLLIVTLVAVVLSMPYMQLLPIFTKDIITLEAEGLAWIAGIPLIGGLLEPLPELFEKSSFRLGTLMTVSGLGALAGSLFIAALPADRRGVYFLGSLMLTAITLVGFSVSPWYFLSLALVIPLGLGQAGRMALSNALVQANSDDRHRGRVMSVYMMEFGVTNFGIFLIAILADVIGVQWAIGGGAALLGVITVYFYTRTPNVRNLA
ncbi:MAG: MFS transporter [Chloroflexota bacterium]|nr:MFS transporter [Chloroflexota bacterium]MDE2969730.1 MFS transporter [Chloroflexota bacterium]